MKDFYCSTRFETTSAPTCIRIPPYSSRTAPIHHYTPKQNNTPTYSHRLLRMNVIKFETCWAIKNFHKATSSWFNLFNYQDDARSNKHKTLYIKFHKIRPVGVEFPADRRDKACRNFATASNKEKVRCVEWRRYVKTGDRRKLINEEFLMRRSTSIMITLNFMEVGMT